MRARPHSAPPPVVRAPSRIAHSHAPYIYL